MNATAAARTAPIRNHVGIRLRRRNGLSGEGLAVGAVDERELFDRFAAEPGELFHRPQSAIQLPWNPVGTRWGRATVAIGSAPMFEASRMAKYDESVSAAWT